ncbi:copper oxidase [Paenibacillus selenitireducens]|uniref:Copper oxidase n=2 Tax=Paenibacillus selenitireducens TaxID=1324314 RepID=A0A1T2X5X2_9BACL|nr:multicopper oxidase family protein [Paenibacillus selenitireducens]OPA75252.1 copper oxidase [Paenibacillus selenitireducens]
MNTIWLKSIIISAVIVLVTTGCFKQNQAKDAAVQMKNESGMSHATDPKLTSAPARVNGKEVTITAQESMLEVAKGETIPVWTFNNSVPGPEIRVKVGDTVKIHLNNQLKVPVSIHWHGYPVPNEMDGIPGVTQDAVAPGKTFTYEFQATVPGTYWYHSHQDSVNQVDKGLYGSFIVEDPKDNYDRDYTLVLDEWMSSSATGMQMNGTSEMDNMAGMDHSQMNMGSGDMDHGNMPMEGHDMSMYDLYTINGKSGNSVEKLSVKKGDKVRLRLINAGYISHQMHLHGHDFKVVSTDGQPMNNPAIIRDQLLSIAPGERYDIEFIADQPGSWLLEEHGTDARIQQMRTYIQYEGISGQKDRSDSDKVLTTFDLTQYGNPSASRFALDQSFDQEVQMNLNTEMKNGEMVYTINGKVYPNTDKIHVKEGESIKVTMVNQSKQDDHPMHLHGHFFQVLSKNGVPLQGSPVVKDTLNVKPGESYVIAFEANNTGYWMFHCHDLHHASAGMVTDVEYTDYRSNYTPDPNAGNIPE